MNMNTQVIVCVETLAVHCLSLSHSYTHTYRLPGWRCLYDNRGYSVKSREIYWHFWLRAHTQSIQYVFLIVPTVPGRPCNWFTPSQFTYRKILHRVTTLSRYSIHLVAVTDNYNSCYYEQSALQWQCCRDTNRILSQWSYCLKNTFSAYKIFL